jgi:hypothetical protein
MKTRTPAPRIVIYPTLNEWRLLARYTQKDGDKTPSRWLVRLMRLELAARQTRQILAKQFPAGKHGLKARSVPVV